MVLGGIEQQPHTSLNNAHNGVSSDLHILALLKSIFVILPNSNICVVSEIFTRFRFNPGVRSWLYVFRTITWIPYIAFQWYFWAMIFDGIEYQHHTSLDMCIMADHVNLIKCHFRLRRLFGGGLNSGSIQLSVLLLLVLLSFLLSSLLLLSLLLLLLLSFIIIIVGGHHLS